jgi:hypothetical protein
MQLLLGADKHGVEHLLCFWYTGGCVFGVLEDFMWKDVLQGTPSAEA